MNWKIYLPGAQKLTFHKIRKAVGGEIEKTFNVYMLSIYGNVIYY